MATRTDLKVFRSNIAALKKKGLISGVDARKVQPTPYLRKLVNKYDAVISGKATPVKLSKEETRKYKQAGYDVASPRGLAKRVIIPHDATEKVTAPAGRKVVIKSKVAGIERVQIPVEYHDLPQYLDQVARKHKTIDRLKGSNEFWAFKFFGHNSHSVYRNIDLLIEDLQAYESVMNAIDNHDTRNMNEMYHHLEIVKITKPALWEQTGKQRKMSFGKGQSDKTKYKRAKKKRERGPEWHREQFKAANAARVQAWRDRLKAEGGKKYDKYLKDGKNRAKKSAKATGKKKGK